MDGADKFTLTVSYITTFDSGAISSEKLDEDTLLEDYKTKIISYSFSEPIQNTFK